jgi:hypothetical protein
VNNVLLLLLVIIVIVSAVLPAVLKLVMKKRAPVPVALPYRKKDYLFTAAERSFYEVLCGVVDGQLHVFPKIRLADLVWMPKGTANQQAHRNRIQSKHVDFVLCDREKIAPVLVIELDDSSHEAEERRERDSFVDSALFAAGLPIFHIPARKAYVPADLAALIQQKLTPA